MYYKSDEIEKVLTRLTGKNRPETIANKLCMTCDTPNMTFTDPLSEQEYHISGMCQTCQDKYIVDLD